MFSPKSPLVHGGEKFIFSKVQKDGLLLYRCETPKCLSKITYNKCDKKVVEELFRHTTYSSSEKLTKNSGKKKKVI